MKSFKIFGAVLAAAMAASMIVTPASADSQKKGSVASIVPAIAGPVGAAALFTTTSTAHWKTMLYKNYFYKWSLKNVLEATKQGLELHKHGFKVDVDIKKTGIKIEGEKKIKHSKTNKRIDGKMVVGCVMGSALGAITASIRKANALGNPLRLRTQAEHEAIVKSGYEKQFELTSEEAATALALCGLGSLALHWQRQAAPAVVTAKY